MQNEEEIKLITAKCFFCHHKIIGQKSSNGIIRTDCPICRTKCVTTFESRRQVHIVMYLPKGQDIISD